MPGVPFLAHAHGFSFDGIRISIEVRRDGGTELPRTPCSGPIPQRIGGQIQNAWCALVANSVLKELCGLPALFIGRIRGTHAIGKLTRQSARGFSSTLLHHSLRPENAGKKKPVPRTAARDGFQLPLCEAPSGITPGRPVNALREGFPPPLEHDGKEARERCAHPDGRSLDRPIRTAVQAF